MSLLKMTSVPFLAMFLRFGVDLLGSPDIIDPRRLLLPFMAGKVRFGSDDARLFKFWAILNTISISIQHFSQDLKMQQVN